ncbi:hypothetical protein LC612_30520 [Nostoc sp. CHAB 5834]|nr:hypothetical protein [Nostoc sp. CHAB 5834]
MLNKFLRVISFFEWFVPVGLLLIGVGLKDFWIAGAGALSLAITLAKKSL